MAFPVWAPQILGWKFVLIVGLLLALSGIYNLYQSSENKALQVEIEQLQEKLEACIVNLETLNIKNQDLQEKNDAIHKFYHDMPKPPSSHSSWLFDKILEKGHPVAAASHTRHEDPPTPATYRCSSKNRRL